MASRFIFSITLAGLLFKIYDKTTRSFIKHEAGRKIMKKRIKNIFGEELDILIEGNTKSDKIIIFVHGYGTDKDEGFASFLEAANFFKENFLTIRFDHAGYGKSQGKDYEFNFQKAAGDVDSIIRFTRKNYPEKKINISAHSLGAFTVALLSPFNINKIVFTSVVNSNTEFVIKKLKERIMTSGGKVNEQMVTHYPRTKGGIQQIGKGFWKTLKNFKPIEYIEELGEKTDLIIFKPKQDEVIEYKFFQEYKKLKNAKYIEINGDHNFKNKGDRLRLFKNIESFLLNEKDWKKR